MSGRTRAGARTLGNLVALVGALVGSPLSASGLQSCGALEPGAFLSVVPDSVTPALQATLREAYGGTDVLRQAGVALSDGVMGPVTDALILRFCRDVGLDLREAGSDTVLLAVRAFARVAARHRDWKDRLTQSEFQAWAAALPEGPFGPFYVVRRTAPLDPGGAFLLGEYDAQVRAPAALDGRHRLTTQTLDSLLVGPEALEYRIAPQSLPRLAATGAPTDLITRVAGLAELGEETSAALEDRVAAVLDLLGREYGAYVAGIAWGSGTLRRDLLESGLPAGIVTGILEAGVTGPAAAENALDRILDRFGAVIEVEAREPPIAEEIVERLQPLLGVRFPDGVMFRKALQLTTGLPADDPSIGRILREARQRPDTAAVLLRPIEWTGGACGCGPEIKITRDVPVQLYGLYPFWAGQINLSMQQIIIPNL